MSPGDFSHQESDSRIRAVKRGEYDANTGITGYFSYRGQNLPFVGSLEVAMEDGLAGVAGELVEEVVATEYSGKVDVDGGAAYHSDYRGFIRNMVGGRIEELTDGLYEMHIEKVPSEPWKARRLDSVDWVLMSEDASTNEMHADDYTGRYSGVYKSPEDRIPVPPTAGSVEAELTVTRPVPDDILEVFASREFPQWVTEAVENPA